jgi:uncharacterized membrane protein
MILKNRFKDFLYEKNRLEAYSDAIIAIVITLLILELKAPHFDTNNLHDSIEKIWELRTEFLGWLISFLLVGIYWFQHHNILHMTNKIDLKIVLINQLSLMGICLTPFTASLLGKNCTNPLSVTLFSAIFFLVSLTLCWLYAYIAKNYLKNTYNKTAVLKNVKLSYLVAPTFYLLAAIVCWFSLTLSFIILLLIPILFLFPLDREEK